MSIKINDEEILSVKVTEVHEVYTNHRLKCFIERHFKTAASQKRVWEFLKKVRAKYPWLGKKLRGELVYRQEIK